MTQEEPKRTLNATAASLLGFLHEGPMSGWDLAMLSQRRIGDFWTITQSQVYRELATMHRLGLVEKGETGARERTPYRITPAGMDAFAEWIEREPGEETLRFPLLLTLSFGNFVDPEHLDRMIATNREAHEHRLTHFLAESPEYLSPYERATLDFGIRYERAVLEWFDRLPTLLGRAPSDHQ
ncbi:PadR family transcriptional regulator [Nocardia stercoris]|uniref:PadR family transcriptional regulator n=1 Tax=Nocardia stercoris TaxID=2483361 RepID=A0A3M2LCA8_9NOCA|nr:PadR family transcriptional regulator [Nocardia stercoris]RMI32318.1 PadR family transcriptional regulator [Nocardia stercoris]